MAKINAQRHVSGTLQAKGLGPQSNKAVDPNSVDNCTLWTDFTDTSKVKTTGSDPGNQIYKVEDKSRQGNDPYQRYFSPTDFADCSLWLDADDASSITLNGTDVSQWNDKSGNSRHLSQSAATNQPALTTAGLNGKSVVTFDGNDNYLVRDDALGFSGNPAASVFIVVKDNEYAGYENRVLNFGRDGNSNDRQNIGFGTDASWRFNGGAHVFANDELDDNVPAIGTWRCPAGQTFADSDFFRNGAAGATTSTSNPSLQVNIPSSVDLYTTLGKGWGQNNDHNDNIFWISGFIAEVIVYNRYITDAERATVETYLQNKWNITVATQSADTIFTSHYPNHLGTEGFGLNNLPSMRATDANLHLDISGSWTSNTGSTVYGVFRKYENSGNDYLLSYGERKIRTSGSNLQWVATGDTTLQASSSLSTGTDYLVTVTEDRTSTFSPTDIVSCSLWLDADDASSITLNGTNISQWTNKAPAPYAGLFDLTQSSAASQPAFVTDGQNGRSVVRFDTTVDEELNGVGSDAYQTPAASNDEVTIFAVCRFTTGHTITRLAVSAIIGWGLDSNYRWDVSPKGWFGFGDGENNSNGHCLVADGYKESSSFVKASLASPFGFTENNRIYSFRNQAAAPLRINGDGSLTLNQNDAPLANTYYSDTAKKWLTVGRGNAESYANNFDGDICEIICYARNLTDAETTTVETYLQNKWNITVATSSYTEGNEPVSSMYLNGVLEQHSTAISSSNTLAYGSIGGSGSSGGNFAGNIGEIVMYDPPVTSWRNRKKVERYLADKYNINYTGFQPDQITASIDATGNSDSKLVLWLDASDQSTVTNTVVEAWVPTDIVSCSLWLDADDASSITLSPAGITSSINTNYALATNGSTASASSISGQWGSPPSVIIDGATDGNGEAKCNHTNQETNSWVQVDFGQSRDINKVVIWNRTDGTNENRLDGYRLDFYTGSNGAGSVVHTISESPGNGWASTTSTLTASIECRSIRLVNEDATQPQFTHIAEFQAFHERGGVSQWTNKAPAPYAGLFDLTQSSAVSQPAFVTDGQNGRSVVRFDYSVDEELNGVGSDAYQTPASSGGELTIFAVCRYSTGHSKTSTYIAGVLGFALNSAYGFYFSGSEGGFAFGDSDDYAGHYLMGETMRFPTNSDFKKISLASPNGFTETNRIYTLRNQATAPLRINGDGSQTLQHNDAPMPGVYQSDTDHKWLTVGRGYADYASNFDGDICEIICYAKNLTDAEMTTVETYLQNKWSVTVATQSSDVTPYSAGISNWSSKVGSISATQTSASYRPTTGSIDGKKMIFFSGSSDSTAPYLEITGAATASLDFVAGTDAYTVFVAHQQNSGSGYDTLIGSGPQYALSYDRNNALLKSDFGTGTVSGSNTHGSTFHLASSLTSTTLNKVYVTGTLSATGAIGSAVTGSSAVHIGAQEVSSSVTNRLQSGSIGEILVYSGSLTNFERKQVEEYLYDKWEIETSASY